MNYEKIEMLTKILAKTGSVCGKSRLLAEDQVKILGEVVSRHVFIDGAKEELHVCRKYFSNFKVMHVIPWSDL